MTTAVPASARRVTKSKTTLSWTGRAISLMPTKKIVQKTSARTGPRVRSKASSSMAKPQPLTSLSNQLLSTRLTSKAPMTPISSNSPKTTNCQPFSGPTSGVRKLVGKT